MNVKTVKVGDLDTNCYIVYKDKTGVIIDPGDDGIKIYNEVLLLGLEIKYIILTHWHFDHVCALDYVKEKTNAKVCIGATDSHMLSKHIPGFPYATLPTTKPDILLNDGDMLNCDSFNMKVMITPGHTAGGISLIGNNCIFCGDTLFKESIGRTDLPGGDYKTEIKSAQKILSYPDDTVLYCGHGEMTTVLHEKNYNFYASGILL